MEKSLAYKPQSIWENADSKTRKDMEALAARLNEKPWNTCVSVLRKMAIQKTSVVTA